MTVDEVIEQLKRTTLVSVNGIVIAVVVHALESLRDENARLSQAAEPEAVEPKDWPDASSVVWSRNGEAYLFGWCEDSRAERVAFIDERGRHNGYTRDLPRGNWLPCTVLVPQAKEPEAKPERPPMIFGKLSGHARYEWFLWRHDSRGDFYWFDIKDGDNGWGSHQLQDVDEQLSDPEAIAIWKNEVERHKAVV